MCIETKKQQRHRRLDLLQLNITTSHTIIESNHLYQQDLNLSISTSCHLLISIHHFNTEETKQNGLQRSKQRRSLRLVGRRYVLRRYPTLQTLNSLLILS